MVINNLFTSDAYRDEQQSISSDQYNPESSGGTPKKTMEGYQNPNIVPEKSARAVALYLGRLTLRRHDGEL